MKKIGYIFLLLAFLTSCKKNIVPKPDKFLNETQMEGLLYDLAVLEAMKNQQSTLLDSLNFKPQEYIYRKYATDSISIEQNMVYYASFPKQYDQIVQRVDNRLKRQRDSLSDVLNKQNKKTEIPEIPELEKELPPNNE
jgi:hypothetical protein